jgi:hypothetical protein
MGKIVLTDISVKTKFMDQDVNMRNLEKNMLIGIMDMAAGAYKKLSDICTCSDFIGRVNNLEDKETEMELDKKDVENIAKGLEVSASNNLQTARPNGWYRCTFLISQLNNLDKGKSGG